MKKIISLFLFFGVISGLLSLLAFAFSIGNQDLKILTYILPGFIFGITISALMFFFFRRRIYLHIIFIIISTVAYSIALKFFMLLNNNNDTTFPLLVSGLIGGGILALALRFTHHISYKYIFVITVISAFAGIPDPDLFRIFPPWQAVIAVMIGYSLWKTDHSSKELVG